MLHGTEPIDKAEQVYRRVAERTNYYKRDRNPPLSDSAFKPLTFDTDGISFTRANYVSGPSAAAELGYVGKNYYIIELNAGDLMELGITFKPDPGPDEKGHAVIPELNIGEIDSDFVATTIDGARKLPFTVHGPFPGSRPPP